MRNLQLRNIPDDVAVGLERLAEKAGMSMNNYAVERLTELVRRVDNASLLATLPDVGIEPASIVSQLDAERGGR